MGTTDSAAQPGAGWNEAQCTAALAQLEQLQVQIDDLRLAIPRIIEPFHRPSNPNTFRLYAQGVIGSQNSIKDLHDSWKHPEAQRTFEHVKKSYSANADLAASASIPSHGWAERERREGKSKKSHKPEGVEEISAALSEEDTTRIVEDVQKTFPSIKLETQDNRISIQFVASAILLNFCISIEREGNDQHKINAECLGIKEPFLTITRCLASRPQASDLRFLLDMIVAYKTVKGTACAKCGKLLDNAMLTPAARRTKQITSENETVETVWEALHESCLE